MFRTLGGDYHFMHAIDAELTFNLNKFKSASAHQLCSSPCDGEGLVQCKLG